MADESMADEFKVEESMHGRQYNSVAKPEKKKRVEHLGHDVRPRYKYIYKYII